MSGVLDFLSPGLAADADGLHPVARSSVERRFREAGATFEERDGWLVPVSVPGEGDHLAVAGIGDLSHLTKLEVRPAPGDLGAGVVSYAISSRRGLVLFPAAQEGTVRARLSDAELVLDVTAQHGILVVAGPEAPTVLRRLTHLHRFPSGGEVAHIVAHVLERGGAYWIVFPQEYGHYLYEVAVDRAAALGGGPVGVDALGAST
jgi:glycine cleavage system aminomethyltransferase T